MTNCMVPRSSVKTGVVICILVLLAFSPKMYFARALNAPSPLPLGLPSSFLPLLLTSIFVSATSTLSYLHFHRPPFESSSTTITKESSCDMHQRSLNFACMRCTLTAP